VIWHKLLGTDPSKLLAAIDSTSSLLSEPMPAGNELESEFSYRNTYDIEDIEPTLEGIDPPKLFEPTPISARFVSKPMLDGSDPVSEFLYRVRRDSDDMSPTLEGIVPTRRIR